MKRILLGMSLLASFLMFNQAVLAQGCCGMNYQTTMSEVTYPYTQAYIAQTSCEPAFSLNPFTGFKNCKKCKADPCDPCQNVIQQPNCTSCDRAYRENTCPCND